MLWQDICPYISILFQLPYFSPNCLDIDLNVAGSMSFLDSFITATFLATVKDISLLCQTSLLCSWWLNLSEMHSLDRKGQRW